MSGFDDTFELSESIQLHLYVHRTNTNPFSPRTSGTEVALASSGDEAMDGGGDDDGCLPVKVTLRDLSVLSESGQSSAAAGTASSGVVAAAAAAAATGGEEPSSASDDSTDPLSHRSQDGATAPSSAITPAASGEEQQSGSGEEDLSPSAKPIPSKVVLVDGLIDLPPPEPEHTVVDSHNPFLEEQSLDTAASAATASHPPIPVVDAAVDSLLRGFNVSLVAFGITGSGKSSALFGNHPHSSAGLSHFIAADLFRKLNKSATASALSASSAASAAVLAHTFVSASFYEVYNETIRDLLAPNPLKPCHVRENPVTGPYVDGLTAIPVHDAATLEKLIRLGQTARTRSFQPTQPASHHPLSHGVFVLHLRKVSMSVGDVDSAEEIVTRLVLADLAGSENSTLYSGEYSDKSLATIIAVLQALSTASAVKARIQSLKQPKLKSFASEDDLADFPDADAEFGETASEPENESTLLSSIPIPPHRDSSLSWLLMDAFGGNSVTYVIGAISEDHDYEWNTRTLDFLSQCRTVVNHARLLQGPKLARIRELQENIVALQKKLADIPEDTDLYDELMTKIDKKVAKVSRLTEEFEKSIVSAQSPSESGETAEGLDARLPPVLAELEGPYLLSLNDSALVSSVVMYNLSGTTVVRIGTLKSALPQHILLDDYPGVEPDHALIENSAGVFTLHPFAPLCFVNGHHVSEPTPLRQGYILELGESVVFRFNHPEEAAKLRADAKASVLSQAWRPIHTPARAGFLSFHFPESTALTSASVDFYGESFPNPFLVESSASADSVSGATNPFSSGPESHGPEESVPTAAAATEPSTAETAEPTDAASEPELGDDSSSTTPDLPAQGGNVAELDRAESQESSRSDSASSSDDGVLVSSHSTASYSSSAGASVLLTESVSDADGFVLVDSSSPTSSSASEAPTSSIDAPAAENHLLASAQENAVTAQAVSPLLKPSFPALPPLERDTLDGAPYIANIVETLTLADVVTSSPKNPFFKGYFSEFKQASIDDLPSLRPLHSVRSSTVIDDVNEQVVTRLSAGKALSASVAVLPTADLFVASKAPDSAVPILESYQSPAAADLSSETSTTDQSFINPFAVDESTTESDKASKDASGHVSDEVDVASLPTSTDPFGDDSIAQPSTSVAGAQGEDLLDPFGDAASALASFESASTAQELNPFAKAAPQDAGDEQPEDLPEGDITESIAAGAEAGADASSPQLTGATEISAADATEPEPAAGADAAKVEDGWDASAQQAQQALPDTSSADIQATGEFAEPATSNEVWDASQQEPEQPQQSEHFGQPEQGLSDQTLEPFAGDDIAAGAGAVDLWSANVDPSQTMFVPLNDINSNHGAAGDYFGDEGSAPRASVGTIVTSSVTSAVFGPEDSVAELSTINNNYGGDYQEDPFASFPPSASVSTAPAAPKVDASATVEKLVQDALAAFPENPLEGEDEVDEFGFAPISSRTPVVSSESEPAIGLGHVPSSLALLSEQPPAVGIASEPLSIEPTPHSAVFHPSESSAFEPVPVHADASRNGNAATIASPDFESVFASPQKPPQQQPKIAAFDAAAPFNPNTSFDAISLGTSAAPSTPGYPSGNLFAGAPANSTTPPANLNSSYLSLDSNLQLDHFGALVDMRRKEEKKALMLEINRLGQIVCNSQDELHDLRQIVPKNLQTPPRKPLLLASPMIKRVSMPSSAGSPLGSPRGKQQQQSSSSSLASTPVKAGPPSRPPAPAAGAVLAKKGAPPPPPRPRPPVPPRPRGIIVEDSTISLSPPSVSAGFALQQRTGGNASVTSDEALLEETLQQFTSLIEIRARIQLLEAAIDSGDFDKEEVEDATHEIVLLRLKEDELKKAEAVEPDPDEVSLMVEVSRLGQLMIETQEELDELKTVAEALETPETKSRRPSLFKLSKRSSKN